MRHYRSIDTFWEEDEVIHLGEGELGNYRLILNGVEKLLISGECGTDLVFGYLSSINFSGKVSLSYADSEHLAYDYVLRDGLLHNLNGPAKVWHSEGIKDSKGRSYSFCSYYRHGKPWYCILIKNKRYYYGHHYKLVNGLAA